MQSCVIVTAQTISTSMYIHHHYLQHSEETTHERKDRSLEVKRTFGRLQLSSSASIDVLAESHRVKDNAVDILSVKATAQGVTNVHSSQTLVFSVFRFGGNRS